MSRIQRTLTLHTSLGPAINYSVQATIPPHLLTKCSAALPRPTWEPVLYYSIVCVMGFFLFCIVVAAYFEADRVSTTDIIHMSKIRQLLTSNGSAQPANTDSSNIFNLKTIGQANGNIHKVNGGSASSNNNNTKTAGGAVNGMVQPSAHNNNHTPTPFPRPHSARRRKEHTFFLLSLIKKGFSYLKLPKISFPNLIGGNGGGGNHVKSKTNKDHHGNNSESKPNDVTKEGGDSGHSKPPLKRENSNSEEETSKHGNRRHSKAAKQQQNDPDLIADLRERERRSKENDNSHKNKSDKKNHNSSNCGGDHQHHSESRQTGDDDMVYITNKGQFT